ncbi:NAD-dependent epimerase/dehydratase family protein [Ilumatobacter nonamiensis]|uniref:NAD-dependent epimerase/dehydratase family protein n=1 Tax=Ilumatobacter nonamiensis TaxID=467093 RepID=UPI00058C24C5|nr:NAD-dependent epimerase/dehydratase family protein [Ilumatobacter nonamiensis]
MRVVVVGGTGNVGSRVIPALAREHAIDEIVGVSRRKPDVDMEKVTWFEVDLATSSLESTIEGADVVIDLAWKIQPSRDESALRRTNLDGTARLLDAVRHCRIPSFVYASSVGTYAPDHEGRASSDPVCRDESWSTSGITTSVYSRQKARVERLLDDVERSHPQLRIVRLRTALVFQEHAASEISRYFLGPLLPTRLLGRRRLPVVPGGDHLRLQAVHAADAADAYVAAALSDVHGAYNIAAEDIVSSADLADVFEARRLTVPPRVLRVGAAVSYSLRLQPTSPGWVDLALQVPMMDTAAARRDLGWSPSHSAIDSLGELLDGFAIGAGTNTPPLTPERTMLPFPP